MKSGSSIATHGETIKADEFLQIFDDVKDMWTTLVELARQIPGAAATFATRTELPPVIEEVFREARRMRQALDKIDEKLEELGAPYYGTWEGMERVLLSRTGRIKALVSVPSENAEKTGDLPPEAQKAVEEFCRYGRSYEWLYERFRSIPSASVQKSDYEEVLADHRRLVRELDAILSAPDAPAKQASLCDLLPLAKLVKAEAKVFREAFDHITMHMQISEPEQMAHMPLNEFIGHASVDDARYWDAP